jgi:hypothetical protein
LADDGKGMMGHDVFLLLTRRALGIRILRRALDPIRPHQQVGRNGTFYFAHPKDGSEKAPAREVILMNDSATKWIRNLPRRWGIGSLSLPMLWGVQLAVTQGIAHPPDGWAAGALRLLGVLVVPLACLGFAWGWSERRYIERCLVDGEGPFKRAIDRSVLRQSCKGAIAGLIYWLFCDALFSAGLLYARAFRAWDGDESTIANISSLADFGIAGAIYGLVLGLISRRNIRRRLSE